MPFPVAGGSLRDLPDDIFDLVSVMMMFLKRFSFTVILPSMVLLSCVELILFLLFLVVLFGVVENTNFLVSS